MAVSGGSSVLQCARLTRMAKTMSLVMTAMAAWATDCWPRC